MAACGNDLQLNSPGGQIVETLLGDQAKKMTGRGNGLGRRNVPAREIAATDIKHFSLLNKEFHGLPDLFPWRMAIDVMHLIDVNMVGLKPSQTVLAGLANMVSRKTAIVRTGSHRLIDFRRQNDTVSPATLPKPATNNLFGQP